MRCPFCSCTETKVIDSRLIGEGDQTRRRRECIECRERFTSYESAELNFPRVIKGDGRREPFREDKLRVGIERAVQKRPVETESVENAVAHVKRKLRTSGEREIGSGQIGEWVMQELRDLDHVAYLRFASVYLRFDDVRAFLDEIEGLLNELPPELRKNQLDLLTDEKKKN